MTSAQRRPYPRAAAIRLRVSAAAGLTPRAMMFIIPGVFPGCHGAGGPAARWLFFKLHDDTGIAKTLSYRVGVVEISSFTGHDVQRILL
jgi:hypothetical protein